MKTLAPLIFSISLAYFGFGLSAKAGAQESSGHVPPPFGRVEWRSSYQKPCKSEADCAPPVTRCRDYGAGLRCEVPRPEAVREKYHLKVLTCHQKSDCPKYEQCDKSPGQDSKDQIGICGATGSEAVINDIHDAEQRLQQQRH